jgi:hypothetical protein
MCIGSLERLPVFVLVSEFALSSSLEDMMVQYS